MPGLANVGGAGVLGRDQSGSSDGAWQNGSRHLNQETGGDDFMKISRWLAERKAVSSRGASDTLTTSTAGDQDSQSTAVTTVTEAEEFIEYGKSVEAGVQTDRVDIDELLATIERLTRDIKDKELELGMVNLSLKNTEKEKVRQAARDEKLKQVKQQLAKVRQTNTQQLQALRDCRAERDSAPEYTRGTREKMDSLEADVDRLQGLVDESKKPADQLSGLNRKIEELMAKVDKGQAKEPKDATVLRMEQMELKKRIEKLSQEIDTAKKINRTSLKNTDADKATIQTLRDRIRTLESQASTSMMRVPIEDLRRAQTEINTLQRDNHDLMTELAWLITELDCAHYNVKQYTCNHSSLMNAWKERSSTMYKHPLGIAKTMFDYYRTDTAFLSEYKHVRRSLIDHHQAHDDGGKAHGSPASFIQAKFYEVDRHRGVDIYS